MSCMCVTLQWNFWKEHLWRSQCGFPIWKTSSCTFLRRTYSDDYVAIREPNCTGHCHARECSKCWQLCINDASPNFICSGTDESCNSCKYVEVMPYTWMHGDSDSIHAGRSRPLRAVHPGQGDKSAAQTYEDKLDGLLGLRSFEMTRPILWSWHAWHGLFSSAIDSATNLLAEIVYRTNWTQGNLWWMPLFDGRLRFMYVACCRCNALALTMVVIFVMLSRITLCISVALCIKLQHCTHQHQKVRVRSLCAESCRLIVFCVLVLRHLIAF